MTRCCWYSSAAAPHSRAHETAITTLLAHISQWKINNKPYCVRLWKRPTECSSAKMEKENYTTENSGMVFILRSISRCSFVDFPATSNWQLLDSNIIIWMHCATWNHFQDVTSFRKYSHRRRFSVGDSEVKSLQWLELLEHDGRNYLCSLLVMHYYVENLFLRIGLVTTVAIWLTLSIYHLYWCMFDACVCLQTRSFITITVNWQSLPENT